MIGADPLGAAPLGAEADTSPIAQDVNISFAVRFDVREDVDIALPVRFDVRDDVNVSIPLRIDVAAETVNILAPVRFDIREDVSLSIPVRFDVGNETVNISAPVRFDVREDVGLSASIRFQVYDPSATTSPSWSLKIVVGGIDLSSILTGQAEINGAENTAGTARFTVKPALGTIDIYSWVNQKVVIDYVSGGQSTRRFTGKVDRPIYDPSTGLTTFMCVDGLPQGFNAMSNEQIYGRLGGYHSPSVFTDDARGWSYAKQLLSTQAKSYELDANGIGQLTDWEAKSTPDFTFGEDDIIYKSLSVDLADRSRLHNTHKVTFQYRYQRLRERFRDFTWYYPEPFLQWVLEPTTLPTVTMIRDAVTGAGWVMSTESWDHLPPAQRITVGMGNDIYWNISETDRLNLLFGARFGIKRRWVQEVTEQYDLRIFANQSVEKLGEIAQVSQFSVQSNEETDGWLEYETTPAGVESTTSNGDKVIDVTSGEVGRADADQALETIQALRKTEILQSHRQNVCRLTVLANPFIDCTKTIKAQTTKVTAKGKVSAWRDRYDYLKATAVTEVTLALSKSQATGVPDETPIAPPAEVEKSDPSASDPQNVELATHVGGREFSPAYDENWTGLLCNNALTAINTFQNRSEDPNAPVEKDKRFSNIFPGSEIYPYEFKVPAPSVDTLLTNAFEAVATHDVEVAIPEDELTMVA